MSPNRRQRIRRKSDGNGAGDRASSDTAACSQRIRHQRRGNGTADPDPALCGKGIGGQRRRRCACDPNRAG